MAREAKIKWFLDKKRQDKGQACYRLSIPAQFTDTGKRKNIYFKSKERAIEKAAEIRRIRDEKGSSVFGLDPGDAKAVLDFKEHFEKCKTSIPEVLATVSRYVKSEEDFLALGKVIEVGQDVERRRTMSVTFAKAAKEMIRLKEEVLKRRPATIRQIRYVVNALSRKAIWFVNKKISDISVEDCRKGLNESFNTPILVDDARRVISGVFALGIKRGYCTTNPTKGMESLHREEKEIVPLRVEEVKRLFAACRMPSEQELEGNDRRVKLDLSVCIPAIAIMTFGGIRPIEVTRLTWADVSFEEKVVSVRGRSSKTGGTRHVTMCQALEAWLKPHQKEGSSPICPPDWRIKWEGVRIRAGWDDKNPWVGDALRHTFASYHVKVYKNFPMLQVEMGHGSANLLRQRYSNLKGVTLEEANRFWKIMPEKKRSNSERQGVVMKNRQSF